jgi:hypothetical protein
MRIAFIVAVGLICLLIGYVWPFLSALRGRGFAWPLWVAWGLLFALFVAFPYLVGDRHSVGADLINSLIFFCAFVLVFVISFRFVFRGGSLGGGVLVFWGMFIVHIIFIAVCYASLPRSLGLPQPDLTGLAPALFIGWLPGIVVSSLATLSRSIAHR